MCREELAIPAEEREVDRSELYVADEAFFCGTGAEVQAISEVDGYKLGSGGIGPVTARIERAFHEMVRGHSPHDHYRTAIYAAEKHQPLSLP
jgi:branched-chain amino acid aminotransferase